MRDAGLLSCNSEMLYRQLSANSVFVLHTLMFWLNCTFDYAVILAVFICTISTFELKLKQQIVGPCQLLKGVT